MPKFNVTVPHELPRDECVKRLQGFSEQFRKDSAVELTDVQEKWDDNGNLDFAFTAMGMKISGQMQTGSDNVTVDGKLPFAAVVFRGTLENQISEKIREAIQVS